MTFVRSQGNIPGSTGVPLDNLVAYVDVGDESSYAGSGTTVTDFIGNLTSGTISGGTAYANGALDFDGATGALTFTKNSNVDDIFSGGGTIMFFFRPRSDGQSSAGALVNTGYDGSGYNLFTENELAGDGGSVRITFEREFSSNDGIWDFLGTDDINVRIIRLDSWNSIAIVYDDSSTANTPRLYVNGQVIPDGQIQVTQTPTGTAVTDAGNDLIIGNRADGLRTYDGDFDVFLAWDVELDAETITKAHTVFAQRHGQHTAEGATARKGSDLFLYAGDYVGTSSDDGGAVFIKGGTTWSDINSSEGGRVEIRGGDSQNTLAGTGGGGAAGVIIAVGGYGDQDSQVHTVGDLSNISSEFGGVTLTAGNGGNRTLFRGVDNISTGAPGVTIVRGGDAYDGSGTDAGAALGIRSGASRGGVKPGPIIIRSGYPATGSQTSDIWITTQQSNDAAGIFGAVGSSGTDTGHIWITTDPPGSTASGAGDIRITAGSTAAVTGNDPGEIIITSGSMNTSGQNFVGGRDITLNAGSSDGAGSSPGGSIVLNAGSQDTTGTNASSPGGDVRMTAGNSAKNDPSSGGGGIIATAGNSSNITPAGGPVTLSAGDNTNTSSSGFGGDVTINGGDVTGTSSTGRGGDITLNPGTAAGTGRDGKVIINGDLCAITALEASEVRTADATASSADPIDINPGISDTGFNGSDLTLSAGTAGSGGTDGRVLIQGDTIFINDRAGTATVGGILRPGSFDVKLEGKNAAASSGNAGHSVTLQGGTGDGAGDGGSIILALGADGGTGTQGDLQIRSPDAPTTDLVRGAFELTEFTLKPENSTTGDGRGIKLQAADTSAGTSDGGNIVLEVGSGTANDGVVQLITDETQVEPAAAAVEFVLWVPTFSGSGAGTDFRVQAQPGETTNDDGGDLVLQAAVSGGGTGVDGDVVFRDSAGTRETRATWTSGNFGFLAPDGTGSGISGSSLRAIAGSGGGGNSDGGSIVLQVGALTGTGEDGGVVYNDSAGNTQGTIYAKFADFQIEGQAGATGGDAGTDIRLTGGDGNTTGAGGTVSLEAGSSPSGTDGRVQYRTASTFTGAEGRLATSATQQTVTLGGGTADIFTVGTLDTNGQNMKFTIYATVVDDGTDTNISSVVIEQTAYRAGGTVSLLTAHRSDQQGNGTMNTDLSFSLVVSTNDVLLRATNGSSTTTYTVNTAVEVLSQEGGFNA